MPAEPADETEQTDPVPPTAPSDRLPAVTPIRVMIGLCVAAPIVALLWVSSYTSTTPKLGGVPFFYWYQLIWVPISAVFTVSAYFLINRDEKLRKATETGESK